MKKIFFLGLLAVTGFTVQSCKKEQTAPSGSSGSMTVKMTDAPGNYAGLSVNITKVEAYLTGSGWVNLSSQSQLVNVLDLTNGLSTTVASNTSLTVGTYSKLRFTFGTNNTLLVTSSTGTTSAQLSIGLGSEIQREIIIDEQVSANSNTEVLIDFNVAASIFESVNGYVLQPVLSEIEDPSTGVQGSIQGSSQASITLQNGAMSYNTYVDASGNFILQGVASGTYNLTIQAFVQSSGTITQQSIQNVVVSEGRITQLGTIQL